ncbi:MAG TPA: HAD family phosphatase [Candidatus Limnocylindrales bacterium]|nr:HAD family phosphatase [Candidatus Limnocylindrales bacterium]
MPPPARPPILPAAFRAVVFDMDGVLLDTEPCWHRAEIELLRRHGGPTDFDPFATTGWSMAATLELYGGWLKVGPEAYPALEAELMAIVHDEYTSSMEHRPGARELVDRLRGVVPLAVASNTARDLVVYALESTGLLDAFDTVVSADEVVHGKPAPDVYLEACRRLGVPPSAAVALEDSESGVASAKAAGLTVVAIPQWAVVDVSAADHVIDSLEQLLA